MDSSKWWLSASIPQLHRIPSVNQNIRMTWNFDWNIIVNVTNYVFVISPICKCYFISSIYYCRSNICLIEVKVKITVILDNVCSQVEIDNTFTAIARFVFYNEKLLTIEFIAYLLA